MASQEPLLQTDREPIRRSRFPYLAFFRQWTKGQPLRETESLDYEPLYNKVYFARRKQPSRRFYGYAGLPITKHMLPYCTHAEPASNSTSVHAHKPLVSGIVAPNCTLCLQVHWPYLGQVLRYFGNRCCHRLNSCSMCCHTGVCLPAKANGSAMDHQHCQAQGSACWLWSPFAHHNKPPDVRCLPGEQYETSHLF